MEQIRNYLNSMFATLPNTENVRKAKRELLAMMEDKYRELIAEGKSENEAVGTVIMEFGNLNELSEELGLTSEVEHAAAEIIELNRDEVVELHRANQKTTIFTALPVAGFILSPSLIILMAAFGELDLPKALTDAGVIFGVIGLLIIVAIGVGVLIYANSIKPKLSDLRYQVFRLNSDASTFVFSVEEKESRRNLILTIIGIGAFIIAAIPPILFSIIGNDFFQTVSVIFVLLFVAIGVALIIYADGTKKFYDRLLNRRPMKPEDVKKLKGYSKISSVIWSLTTIVYLVYSFITFNWAFSWIIFPVVGIILSLFEKLFDLETD